MNDIPEIPEIQTETATEIDTETAAPKHRRRRIVPIVVALSVIAVLGIALVAWRLKSGTSGRPVPAPRSVSFNETPDHSTMNTDQRLTLTTEQLQQTKLKIETVGESPSAEAMGTMTTGIVQANSYKETPVISIVGGIVRTVNGELGQNMRRGQQVAMVFSNELAETQAKYLTALAVVDEHHQHHMRTEKLVEIGAASRQDLEMANSQYWEAESNLENLRQKLILLGLSPQRVNALTSTSQINSDVPIPSPVNGTITSRTVNPGEVIGANKELMRITDLSSVWIIGQVYEKDLALIHVGSAASITSETYPNRTFRGRVSYVDPNIDQATRTAQVRIELANPGQMFKIGMYVNIGFAEAGSAAITQATIPKDAVQTIGNQQVVFLVTEKAGDFLLRPVQLGPETEGFYRVMEGVNAGDRIVTQGSFLLRAEWLKTHPIE